MPFLGFLRLIVLLEIRAITTIVFALEHEASVESYRGKRSKDQ
jgi:hypothetical protein